MDENSKKSSDPTRKTSSEPLWRAGAVRRNQSSISAESLPSADSRFSSRSSTSPSLSPRNSLNVPSEQGKPPTKQLTSAKEQRKSSNGKSALSRFFTISGKSFRGQSVNKAPKDDHVVKDSEPSSLHASPAAPPEGMFTCYRKHFTERFSKEDWRVEVTVVRAAHIIALDKSTLSTPFVKVGMLGTEVRTSYQKETLNPVWDESFTFLVPNTKYNIYAMFNCFHWNAGAKDQFLGYVKVDITSLLEVLMSKQSLPFLELSRVYPFMPIEMNDKVTGDLEVKITIYRNEYEDPDHILEELATTPEPTSDKPTPPKLVRIFSTSSVVQPHNVDLVLIPSFSENYMKTWSIMDSPHQLWPSRWLKRDISGSVRLLYVKYRRNGITTPDSYLKTISSEILGILTGHAEAGKDRPIVILAHGFGGLIAKKILTEASTFTQGPCFNFAKQTKGIIFFGTPLTESHLSDLAPLYLKNSVAAVKHELQLKPLEELEASFSPLAKSDDNQHGWIKVINFVETKPTDERPFFCGVVVNDSAHLGYGQKFLIEASHLALTNPTTDKDVVYQHTMNFINDVVKETKEMAAALRRMSRAEPTVLKHVSTSKEQLPVALDEKKPKEASPPVLHRQSLANQSTAVFVYNDLQTNNVTQDVDACVPAEEPPEYYGYQGNISREESEKMLAIHAPGTYLVRWSDRANSYVVSFVSHSRAVQHLADIHENDNNEVLVKTRNGIVTYPGLYQFIVELRKQGQISTPVPQDENPYGVSGF